MPTLDEHLDFSARLNLRTNVSAMFSRYVSFPGSSSKRHVLAGLP